MWIEVIVLILDESEDMFLVKLLDGQSGWVEKIV